MREMQVLVYAQRDRQHLLVKATPTSGKSRVMMFVALDKHRPCEDFDDGRVKFQKKRCKLCIFA